MSIQELLVWLFFLAVVFFCCSIYSALTVSAQYNHGMLSVHCNWSEKYTRTKRRPCIAYLMGGHDKEVIITNQTAKIYNTNFDHKNFDIYTIDIRADGWYHTLEDGSVTLVNTADFTLDMGKGSITFDAVFSGITGTPVEEDGNLQAYFRSLRIPYTGYNAATSHTICIKSFAVALATFHGIPVAKSCHVAKSDSMNVEAICNELQLPVFVKPCNSGSFIGLTKVLESGELRGALERAFLKDDQVVVEEFISGQEFTVDVSPTKSSIEVVPLPRRPNQHLPIETKDRSKCQADTPIWMENIVAEKLRQVASKVYIAFDCRGVVRIDFVYNKERREPFILGIDTVPSQGAVGISQQHENALKETSRDSELWLQKTKRRQHRRGSAAA